MRSPLAARLARVALFGAALSWCAAGTAHATPTIWATARNPALAEREALIGQLDALWSKWSVARNTDRTIGLFYLMQMRDLLESGGAEQSGDPRLLMLLATVLQEEAESGGVGGPESKRSLDHAAAIYRSIGKSDTAPPPDRAEAWSRLAICLAHLGRPADEIHAYDEALALQSDIATRARLLANRAEANMVLGDLTSAVQGYRGALAELSQGPSAWVGVLAPTTLWGLAVAEDRSGDLTASLDSVSVARRYDPNDHEIDGANWFYVPDYDEAWYHALGHWSAARSATLEAVRAEFYSRAVASWEDYIARATPDDRWLPLAKARLALCSKEASRIGARRGAGTLSRPPRDPSRTSRPH